MRRSCYRPRADSPALRELAGLSRSDGNAELFPMVLGELDVGLPDESTTERCVLHRLAARLAAGAVTPSEVAAEVGRSTHPGRTAAERAFVAAVDREYCVEHLAAQEPEVFRAWQEALRPATERLCRTPFPTW
ncbi:hypothetical protein ACIRD3_17980 [Kitasatospora sp. NPDC093550]|uniref:hypothetical protein n=1 Tax=Kitasatospora sp. NPDC093550 TaxID=3364089 RepID=UPI0037F8FFF9